MGMPLELQQSEIERFFSDLNRSVSNNIAAFGTFNPLIPDAAMIALAAFTYAFGWERQKS